MMQKNNPSCPLYSVARRLVAVALIVCLTLAPVRLFAKEEQESMIFIRDAEIEHYLRALGTPIFRVADLDPKAVSILIIQNGEINAFVAGGINIFIYTGLLLACDTPEQLQGVIAHETAHIAGGHLARGAQAMRNASAQAIIGMLVGLAAGIASGKGEVAVGAIGGAQEIAERNLMSYSREQESFADTAALRFLDSTGQSSKGMLEFMKKLAGQDILPIDRQIEYVRTHPLSQDRVNNVEHHLQSRPDLADKTLGSAFLMMHERMKAKLLGYLQPETALLRYTDKDPRLPARYARAIALYRTSQLPRALAVVETLLKEEPENPFFIELKAQMLFENGHVAESVILYKKTVDLVPDSALLHVAYAHALLESKKDSVLDLVITQLTEANRLEERDGQTWRFLAAAWTRKAEITKDPQYQGLVSYALAEEAISKGQDKEAGQYAARALKTLSKGSPYWLRAQDIKLNVEHNRND
ncbi:MAG: M48 family metalloprotease [Bdellovibrionales bacterium]|jgi:predicted Zn-dependent protease